MGCGQTAWKAALQTEPGGPGGQQVWVKKVRRILRCISRSQLVQGNDFPQHYMLVKPLL